MNPLSKKFVAGLCGMVALLALISYFSVQLDAVGAANAPKRSFTIAPGEGFRAIANRLAGEHLIRSSMSFEFFSIFTGSAARLKPGTYQLSSAMTGLSILRELVLGSHREVAVRIPEGASVYEIDNMLSGAGIIRQGALVAFNVSSSVEGMLFPDTYKFFTDSDVSEVVVKCKDNFAAKTASLNTDFTANAGKQDLIFASILEKEVPGIEDQRMVAGILLKRIKAGVPLQVDSSVCYAKESVGFPDLRSCYPLASTDFRIGSPYNTYLHGGLPPGPIGNPGIQAITAALQPKSSPYWYYLSDPKTAKTIFAITLDEQSKNKVQYLR